MNYTNFSISALVAANNSQQQQQQQQQLKHHSAGNRARSQLIGSHKCADLSSQPVKMSSRNSPNSFLSTTNQAFSIAKQPAPQTQSVPMQANARMHLQAASSPQFAASQHHHQLSPFVRTIQQTGCWLPPPLPQLPVGPEARAGLMEAQHGTPFSLASSGGPLASKAIQEAYFQQPRSQLVNRLMLAGSPLLGARQQESSMVVDQFSDNIQQQQQKLNCSALLPAASQLNKPSEEVKLACIHSPVGFSAMKSGSNKGQPGACSTNGAQTAHDNSRLMLDTNQVVAGDQHELHQNTDRLYCESNNNSTTSNNGGDDEDDDGDDDDDDEQDGRRRARKTKIPKTVSSERA